MPFLVKKINFDIIPGPNHEVNIFFYFTIWGVIYDSFHIYGKNGIPMTKHKKIPIC